MAVDKDAGSRGRTAGAFDGEGVLRALAKAGGDERAEREVVRAHLAEFSESAREAKLDALRSGVAEARERREKEKPPPDRWTLINGLEQKDEEVGREWRVAARSVAAGLDEFVQSDPQKDRGWLQRDIAALKSPDYDPFAQRRGGAVEREPAEAISPARAGVLRPLRREWMERRAERLLRRGMGIGMRTRARSGSRSPRGSWTIRRIPKRS